MSGIAGALLGDECRMTPAEAELIREPLERVFARMHVEALERLSVWMDPTTVLIGVLAYGSRVARVLADRSKGEGPDGRAPEETPAPPAPPAEDVKPPAPPAEDTSKGNGFSREGLPTGALVPVEIRETMPGHR